MNQMRNNNVSTYTVLALCQADVSVLHINLSDPLTILQLTLLLPHFTNEESKFQESSVFVQVAELGHNQRLWVQSPCFSHLTRQASYWHGHSASPSELTRHGRYTGGSTPGQKPAVWKEYIVNTLQMLKILFQSKNKKPPISAAHREQAFHTLRDSIHCLAGLADFLPRWGAL